MTKTSKEVAAAVLIAVAVIVVPRYFLNTEPSFSVEDPQAVHADRAALPRLPLRTAPVVSRSFEVSDDSFDEGQGLDRNPLSLDELDLPPEAEAHFRSLDRGQQAKLIEMLRVRQQAKQRKQEKLRLDAMAKVMGVELENFTESELDEIKSLIVNGKLEEAASYAGIDLASLSTAQLSALSEVMYEPTTSPEKAEKPIAPVSDPYQPYREAVGDIDPQQQEEQQRRTGQYLSVVAEMNGGQYPSAPVEDVAAELENDPYRELREYQAGEAQETEHRVETYVEQAAESERRARRKE